MSLASGTCLGPYEVTAQIGLGGMGEVYEAIDTRLKRRVALKVLSQSFSADPDRLARFQREAEVLAALNHPNIAQIHGLEEASGLTALVMELVEGPTLADRIAQRPIPVVEALPIARQIAEALEAAHEQGVVHRDLKPANIKVREDGTVKVLDFGLAKAIEPAATAAAEVTQSPTITSPALTRAGLILGTAAYMSPEQARGKSVDKRADIWAFGCVVYEMLTGRRAFGGNEITDTLAFIITKEPDWTALPLDTPSTIRRLLRRCLEKDPRNRLHDIADARLEVQDASVNPEESGATGMQALSAWRRVAPWAVAVLTVVVAIVVIWVTWRPAPPERRVVHFVLPLPEETFPVAGGVALSRDGSRVAFVGGPRSQIYVRLLNAVESTLLPETAGASWLSFSPDGRSISYVDPRELRTVSIDGGRAVRLADVTTEVSPPVQYWRSDDTILFTSKGVLMRVPSGGGTPERVGPPEGAPYFLPRLRLDGPTVIAFSVPNGSVELDVQSGRLTKVAGPGWQEVARGGCMPEFVPVENGGATGFRICYNSQLATIQAAPLDESRLQSTGEMRTVVEGVQPVVGPYGSFAVSESGTLAYVAGNFRGIPPSTLVWVDRAGREEPLSAPERRYEAVALSPDGQRIAMQVFDGAAFQGQRDIWVYDLARNTPSRLTFEGNSSGPVWTRDGTRIVHSLTARGVRSVSVDGGVLATLADAPLHRWVPTSTSPDGTLIAGVGNPGDALQRTMSIIHVGKPGTGPEPFMDRPQFSESGARFSPNGRFVAYASDETGRDQIYVAAYPQGGTWTVSADGGTSPRWRADGRELFYRNGARMMAVDVETTAAFRAGVAEVLFERENFGGPEEPYDVAPDGKRFLMLKPSVTRSTRPELHIVVNWVEELKRLVP